MAPYLGRRTEQMTKNMEANGVFPPSQKLHVPQNVRSRANFRAQYSHITPPWRTAPAPISANPVGPDVPIQPIQRLSHLFLYLRTRGRSAPDSSSYSVNNTQASYMMKFWWVWRSIVSIWIIINIMVPTLNEINIATINQIVGKQDIHCNSSYQKRRVLCKSIIYSTGLNIKLDLKFHVLHAMSNRSESMFGLKPRLIYAALLLTFTALSFPPWSDAIDADSFVSLPLNLLSLGANVGCNTHWFPFFHATVLARYPLS